MSTRKDYKPRKSGRSGKKPVSGWLWLSTGLVVGLFVAMLVFLSGKREQMRASSEAAPNARATVESTRPAKPVRTPPPVVKPRYDFYAILPQKEVNISKEELEAVDPGGESRYQGPWMLQAGSFRNYSDADRLKANLAFQGLESSIDRSENNSGTWHRVRLGPYQSRREADRIKSRLARLNVNSIILKSRP
jgi:cell division protein FtsN